MLHTVYKTTNLINGKYYFGYHKTNDPHDSYLGSGIYIKNAVAKYGISNFRKEVLFTYLDAESAFGKETELVEVFRNDSLCMNLRRGGSGGFDYINSHGLTTGLTAEGKRKIRESKLGVKRPSHVGLAVAEANRKRTGWHHSEDVCSRIGSSGRKTKAGSPGKWGRPKGFRHSDETRRKISAAKKRLSTAP